MASAEKPKPTWRDVKAELDGFDRAGLLGLIKDLHGASRDNEAFLSARLGLGTDPLEHYRKGITRWICPDVMKGQNVSVAKAKKAISDLLSWCDMDDEGYYTALVRMFEQALTAVDRLPASERASFYERLGPVRSAANNLGWGVKGAFDDLWYSRVETS